MVVSPASHWRGRTREFWRTETHGWWCLAAIGHARLRLAGRTSGSIARVASGPSGAAEPTLTIPSPYQDESMLATVRPFCHVRAPVGLLLRVWPGPGSPYASRSDFGQHNWAFPVSNALETVEPTVRLTSSSGRLSAGPYWAALPALWQLQNVSSSPVWKSCASLTSHSKKPSKLPQQSVSSPLTGRSASNAATAPVTESAR